LAHPTRFERVTFAFGGQFLGFVSICRPLRNLAAKPHKAGIFSLVACLDLQQLA
jgi:hypothetical protein